MQVRLTGRWGARLPGSIISVSKKRALYLQNKLKIGKIIEPQPERQTMSEAKAKIDAENSENSGAGTGDGQTKKKQTAKKDKKA